MGVVWKATDTTLGRDVAIKVLPETFHRDPERTARFEREARLLASLNHPNIAAIYGVGSAACVRFLAMELVEGEDLAARLARGSLSVAETLDLGRQVAEGLEVAHEKGIIHRDLKPANVKLTPDGRVKLLDFGLAKALEAQPATTTSTPASLAPTLTSPMTAAQVILGTAAYMSPEQARGKLVDRRADIWAFGCMLYECLTGKRAFEGETPSDTIARILEREPDWTALSSTIPVRLRELLRRCLEKDARKRLNAALQDGTALETFARVIAGQGGNPAVCDDLDLLPQAVARHEVKAASGGTIRRVATRELGLLSIEIGCGRARKEDVVDPASGFRVLKAPLAAGRLRWGFCSGILFSSHTD